MPLFAAGWASAVLHEPITTAELAGGIGTAIAAWIATVEIRPLASRSADHQLPEEDSSADEQREEVASPLGIVAPIRQERRRAQTAAAAAATAAAGGGGGSGGGGRSVAAESGSNDLEAP